MNRFSLIRFPSLIMIVLLISLTTQLNATEDPRLNRKVNRMERYIYGDSQKGKCEERLRALHQDLLGRDSAQGASDKADYLYRFLFRGTEKSPSLDMKVSFLEWKVFHETHRGRLPERLDSLEKLIGGKPSSEPLAFRVEQLVQMTLENGLITIHPVKIPRGMKFRVRLDRPISSQSAKPGDDFVVSVPEDVILEKNVLIVPKGGYACGDVDGVRKPGRFGRSGRLRLTVNEVAGIDATLIPVAIDGPPESFDKKKIGLAVGASAVGYIALGGPVGLVGGIFVKGRDAVIPEGTEFLVTAQEDTYVNGVVINRR